MQKLNLPEYDLKLKESNGKLFVFDPFRSKYLQLTPEERVRQLFARYLVSEKGYPASLMMTEHALQLNSMLRRCDIIVFGRDTKAKLLVECKAPEVKITQDVFDQISRYNIVFQVSYLIVTNGIQHYCCHVDYENSSVSFLKDIPEYQQII